MKTVKALLVVLLSMAFMVTAAMAAESRPRYKKTTGQVVSATPTSIVIKGRAKQPVTVAINSGTEITGAKAAKAGDTAAVNYRADKNGNTATKIKVVEQAPEKQAASPAAQSAPARAN
jgi:hypothetical protein